MTLWDTRNQLSWCVSVVFAVISNICEEDYSTATDIYYRQRLLGKSPPEAPQKIDLHRNVTMTRILQVSTLRSRMFNFPSHKAEQARLGGVKLPRTLPHWRGELLDST